MRTQRDPLVYSAWLTAIVLALVFSVAVVGSLFAYPSVGGVRAVWAEGPWQYWVALVSVALLYTIVLTCGQSWAARSVLAATAVLLVAFGVALGTMRMGPLDDEWYAVATADEPEVDQFEAFALIEFESPSAAPCGGAPGRCVLLHFDDGRRMWLPLGPQVDPRARIVVVERPTGMFSGRHRLVVRWAFDTEDWRLSWALHLRSAARDLDESQPLEY